MNFIYPLFLVAGISLAIPIIIHLFNFRKFKKIYFPDVRFLKEIKEQTNKRSKLKHILILISRLLALACLVFAFAQPFFNKNGNPNREARCSNIYIDNSYSMDVQKNGISLLQLAKNKAKEIIEAGSPKDKYQVLTNDFAFSGNKLLSKEEALAYINTIKISAQSKPASQVLQKQQALLQTVDIAQRQQIFLSDFQVSKCPLPILNKSTINKVMIPVQATQKKNVAIDTAYFETPSIQMNVDQSLLIRIKNFDEDNATNTTVSVKNNDQIKSVINVSLKPGETKIENVAFKTNMAGWQNIKIYCNDYPVNFDDTFFVSANVSSNHSVLIANSGSINPYLNAVFRSGPGFRLENNNINNLSLDKSKNYSLIIVDNVDAFSESTQDVLLKYVEEGGNLLLFPTLRADFSSYNSLLNRLAAAYIVAKDTAKQDVVAFAREHELIKDVFDKIPDNVELPFAKQHYALQSGTLNLEQKVFTFANGDGFLNVYKNGNGKFYLCTAPAESQVTNFPTSYWFLPILYKMAFISSNEKIHAYTIGKDAFVYLKNNKAGDNNVFHVSNKLWDAIPEQRNVGNQILLNLNNAVQQAGIYDIKLPAALEHFYVGLNYDRSESDLKCWSLAELQGKANLSNAKFMEASTANLSEISKYSSSSAGWKVCLYLALLFILLEIALIRLFK